MSLVPVVPTTPPSSSTDLPLRPDPVDFSPIQRLKRELKAERSKSAPYPPGDLDFSLARTRGFAKNPLPWILDGYERFGPIFTLRVMSVPIIFMVGPEANHFVLVSGADNFSWREGSMGDLTPLLGDGLLTTDGAYHRRARKIMLPAFHTRQIARSGEVMLEEIESAVGRLGEGERIDLYDWTRRLALRIAMRALFGLDPDGREGKTAHDFEDALEFYSRDFFIQMLRGPGSPFRKLQRSSLKLDQLIFGEIASRRAAGSPEEAIDLLGLLLSATDEEGRTLTDQEIRDQVMTLLFAGHDTTTSTVTFLMYELARHPHELGALLAEQDEVLAGRSPLPADLTGSTLPRLEMAIEETLRLYPPAWVGPRRAVKDFEFNGARVSEGLQVNYSSWASHHLPDVWPEPEAFRPERFAPEAKALIPKGAYVPFGGGSRTCIGMRFGEMEVRAIATEILHHCRLESSAGYELSIRQMPTLSPRAGMPMTVRERGLPATVRRP
jgi:cytochrome P450